MAGHTFVYGFCSIGAGLGAGGGFMPPGPPPSLRPGQLRGQLRGQLLCPPLALRCVRLELTQFQEILPTNWAQGGWWRWQRYRPRAAATTGVPAPRLNHPHHHHLWRRRR